MKTSLARRAFGILLLAAVAPPAAPLTGQTPDWTLDVPVRLSALDPAVQHVVVSCLVGPHETDARYMQHHWVGSPEAGILEWNGINLPPFAAGVAVVGTAGRSSLDTQVTVAVYAPPAMTVAQKTEATTWTCGLALSINPGEPMDRIVPDPDHDDDFARPAPGSPLVAVVTGTFD